MIQDSFLKKSGKGYWIASTQRICSMCIVVKLCIWSFCFIAFVASKSDVASLLLTWHSSDEFIGNGISPEWTQNGWKAIPIRSHNVRMPIEEMDYLLEKYWYPRIEKDPS